MSPKKKKDVLAESTLMLNEVNKELHQRFPDLPEDVQALLVQKGALMQCVTRELGVLLEQSSEKLLHYEKLLDYCENWKEEFFSPLRAQCEDERLEDPVDTNDLDQLVREMDSMLVAAGRKK